VLCLFCFITICPAHNSVWLCLSSCCLMVSNFLYWTWADWTKKLAQGENTNNLFACRKLRLISILDVSIEIDNWQFAGYLSVPKGLDGSTRSSLSEFSGISGASTRTYVSEASTLVLETIENGVKKHYLVPLSLAQRSKWRKKGVKLHIFNDHTFVAKHLPG